MNGAVDLYKACSKHGIKPIVGLEAYLVDDHRAIREQTRYERNHLTYPGDDPNSPAIFVAHDMTHVIAGYEPTGPGELALGAFQISMNDSDAHWIAFLGSIAIHEAGWYTAPGFVGKTATLSRPGALDTFAEAFERGQQCTGDFTAVDHLAMVERPLADVRAEYNVVPVVHDR